LARCTLLQGERAEALDNLMEAYVDRFAPSGNVEYGLIEEMVSAHWRLRRLWAIETRSMDKAGALQPAPDALGRITAAFAHLAEGPLAAQLHRQETRLHRLHQRAMYNLLWLRSAVPEQPLPDQELADGPGPLLPDGPAPPPSAPEDPSPPVPNEPSPISGHPAYTPPDPPVPDPDLPVPLKLNCAVPNEPSPISGHSVGACRWQAQSAGASAQEAFLPDEPNSHPKPQDNASTCTPESEPVRAVPNEPSPISGHPACTPPDPPYPTRICRSRSS
jgi:hypothetical protein